MQEEYLNISFRYFVLMPSIKTDKKLIILNAIKKEFPIDLSIQEIADKTNISRETVSKYILVLEAEGKIVKTREIGKAKMYRINK